MYIYRAGLIPTRLHTEQHITLFLIALKNDVTSLIVDVWGQYWFSYLADLSLCWLLHTTSTHISDNNCLFKSDSDQTFYSNLTEQCFTFISANT